MIKKIYKVFLLLLIGGAITGCNQFIDESININPDSPTTMTPELLLTSIEARMGYTTIGGNDMARTVSLWTQQITGVDRQSLVTTNYTVKAEDGNNYWNSTYSGTMMDIVQMRNLANEKNAPHYLGVSNVLMALSIAHTTDVFGDVPFSEAFQGALGLSPSYDAQEAVYMKIDEMLVEALTLFAEEPGNFPVDGNYDYLFGGDIDKWINITYALQARYFIHRSNVDDTYYDKALMAAELFTSSNDADMQLNFSSSAGQDNPLFQFQNERGDISSCSTVIDLLKREFDGEIDPRLAAYAYPLVKDVKVGNEVLPAGSYHGNIPGEKIGGLSQPGRAIADANSPVIFMSNVEVLYIKAEVEYIRGRFDNAKVFAIEAVIASMAKWGVSNDGYLNGYSNYLLGLDGEALFKEIMIGKYLGCYFQLEVYNDFRRTNNVIGLIPNQNTPIANPKIPSRFLYPTDELNLNSRTPKGITQNNKVWWDQ